MRATRSGTPTHPMIPTNTHPLPRTTPHHHRVERSKGSHLATPTISQLLNEQPNRPSGTDPTLQLLEHNTPHLESGVPCEDKAY